MNIDLDSFIPIERRSLSRLNTSVVSINSNGIGIGSQVVLTLAEPKAKSVIVRIEYSPEAKALRLSKGDGQHGFVFSVNESSGTGTLNNLPVALKSQRVPRGKYYPAEKYPNIFVLESEEAAAPNESPADRRARYFVEDNSKIAAGDIVTWSCRPERRHGGTFLATGEVVSLAKTEDKGVIETWATIRPISKNWLDTFTDRKTTRLKVSNLIIREKANDN